MKSTWTYTALKKVAVSGYFDPIHKGHLRMFQEAKKLGNHLTVIINNDKQTMNKKGFVFMPAKERAEIIKALACVDEVFISTDKDQTVCKSLAKIKPDIFANGGDRFLDNIPEVKICNKYRIEMEFNIGGGKVNSSSEMAKRIWGQWEVLSKGKNYKVKRLDVLPFKSLSLQRHKKRAEHWIIVNGTASVKTQITRNGELTEFSLMENESIYIPKKTWHQLINLSNKPLSVIEVATGKYIEEDDIERKEEETE